MVPLLNHASLLEVVEGEKGQSDPRGGLSKAKDVKLPVVVGLLRINAVCLVGSFTHCDAQVAWLAQGGVQRQGIFC